MTNKPISPMLWFIVAIPFVYLAYRYPELPAKVPIHYNHRGEADSWAPKIMLWFLLFVLPVLNLLIMTRFIPMMDTEKSIEKMGKKYDHLTFGMVSIMSALATYIVYEAGNEQLGHLNLLLVLLGTILAFVGNYFQSMRPNRYMGIRTPWTLKSDTVWKKTHRLGGRLWFAGGILLALSGLILPVAFNVYLLIGIVVLVCFIPVWYSYHLYQQEEPKDMV